MMLARSIGAFSPVDCKFCLEKIQWYDQKSSKFSIAFNTENVDVANEVRRCLEQESS